MIKNGEHIVSQTYDAASNTWLYATNKGGVYTLNPSGQAGGQFYGSYLGLPAQDQQGNANRQFSSISATPNGGYTLTSTGGHTYNFGPGAGQYNSQTQVKPLPGPQNFTSGGTAKGWGIP